MLIAFLIILLMGTLVALVFAINMMWHTLRTGLPYVSTPDWAIDWLVNNLHLSERDHVFELGCGDARVLAAIAKQFPKTKCVGIEIQLWPYLLAKWKTRTIPNVTIVHGNIYAHDLAAATVIYGFYITAFVQKLSTYLRQRLKTGTRVFSFGFSLNDWSPVQKIENPKKSTGSKLIEYRV